MKLRIISVGHKMPDWVNQACQDYLKRMPREMQLDIVEIKPDKRAAGKNSQTVQQAEAKRILEACGQDYRVVLDEHGQQISTQQLATQMQDWQQLGKNVSLIIGGADGLDASIIASANFVWGLSKLTLPHAMVRVLVSEQIYRAWSIIQQHPYHRE
ncbi:MAG: 23S rRNA (pseudouridine(1915)-N(3))-methyltransferase RlmH [Candidatus Methylopumilus sp.]|nr:23S rRNA (pseudouridine(1915)-N(3))-methyltransferase RlmH [Candidatus Methylopumilus sp.]